MRQQEDDDFAAYVSARTGMLLHYAHVLTGSRARAEDLVQAALAGAYRRWPAVRSGNADAYVRRAILNGHLNRWRRLLRREVLVGVPPERLHDDGTELLAERDLLWRALATLPPRQRAVLVLRYYEDLSEVQIAEVLGVSTGTVKSSASKALARLRSSAELREDIGADDAAVGEGRR